MSFNGVKSFFIKWPPFQNGRCFCVILFYTNMDANKYYYYFLMVFFLGLDLIWVTFCVNIPTQYYLLFLLSHPIEDLGTYCFYSVSFFFLSFFLPFFLSFFISKSWTCPDGISKMDSPIFLKLHTKIGQHLKVCT